MTRAQLRRIFLRHRGAAGRLAVDHGVHKTTVSGWLIGRFKSQRMADAINTRAMELLEYERTKLGRASRHETSVTGR